MLEHEWNNPSVQERGSGTTHPCRKEGRSSKHRATSGIATYRMSCTVDCNFLTDLPTAGPSICSSKAAVRSKFVTTGLQPRCLYNRVSLSKDCDHHTECRKDAVSVLFRQAVLERGRDRTCKLSHCDITNFWKNTTTRRNDGQWRNSLRIGLTGVITSCPMYVPGAGAITRLMSSTFMPSKTSEAAKSISL